MTSSLTSTTSTSRTSERRDKLGRRIGYNWWREFIMEMYSPAREQWEVAFDLGANATYRPGIIAEAQRKTRRGGRNEVTDFVADNPPPTLKAYLLANAGMKGRIDS